MPELLEILSKPPLRRTYWVLEKKFLAGSYAGQLDPQSHRERLSGLFQAGVRTIVSLMEEDETNSGGKPFRPYVEDFVRIAANANEPVTCLRFPIVDQSITTPEQMTKILDAIDDSLDSNRPVYLHCFGGIGRTGSVVCCWLLRHGYATVDSVFALLTRLRQADEERAWRDAPENEKQKGFVRSWANLCGAFPVAIPCGSDWFSRLAGFAERNPAEVRQHLSVHGSQLKSRVNQTTYEFGQLELVSLGKLREKSAELLGTGPLNVAEHVGDARALHADVQNANAMFQVASQFNLLEMVSPSVTPEQGVKIYERDPTQGPACAIACGAGTIYRNYFIDIDGQLGQTAERQVDCLADIGEALGNAQGQLWEMRNGYALPSKSGLSRVDQQLTAMSDAELDELRAKLKIGVQWDTQVTIDDHSHLVTQAYCSALPVAYSNLAPSLWQRFAKLILDAAYEATLAAAVLNAAKTGNKSVYLTMLGGGAFGNERDWILDAIRRACMLFKDHALNVKLVSYRSANPAVKQLVKAIQSEIDGHARNK